METKETKKLPSDQMNAITIEVYLLNKLNEIHQSNPNHEMFGSVSDGKIRAPFERKPSDRANAVTWTKIIKTLAKQLKKQGVTRIDSNYCWMSKSTQIKLCRQEDSKNKLCKSVLWTRFLAFLKTPSHDNWNSK